MRLDGMPITNHPLREKSSGADAAGDGSGSGNDVVRTAGGKGGGTSGGGVQTGFPLGFVATDPSGGTTVGKKKNRKRHYLNNHLVFNVLVHKMVLSPEQVKAYEAFQQHDQLHDQLHGWMIVGFEVLPCSVTKKWLDLAGDTSAPSSACINAEPQEIVSGADVTFSFDVHWQESDTPWAKRWDAYLTMTGGGDGVNDIHWFSIVNSLFVTCFLAGLIFIIMLRTVRNDLSDDVVSRNTFYVIMLSSFITSSPFIYHHHQRSGLHHHNKSITTNKKINRELFCTLTTS